MLDKSSKKLDVFAREPGHTRNSILGYNTYAITITYEPRQSQCVPLISKSENECPHSKQIHAALDEGEHIKDCRELTKTQLRVKYRREANSHRNMLSRQKSREARIHPSFKEFKKFLEIMGPIPAKGATLDRINNTDPEYAPGKVRWADKRTQNNNKSDTIIFSDKNTGDYFTASRLAKQQGISASAIRKRSARGWSNEEIIAGKSTRSLHYAASSAEPEHKKDIPPYHRQKTHRPLVAVARDEQYQRDAEYAKYQRETTGEEPLVATYEALIDFAGPFGKDITPESYKKRFTEDWIRMRAHVQYENVYPSHKELIAEIDPGYVKAQLAKEKLANVL